MTAETLWALTGVIVGAAASTIGGYVVSLRQSTRQRRAEVCLDVLPSLILKVERLVLHAEEHGGAHTRPLWEEIDTVRRLAIVASRRDSQWATAIHTRFRAADSHSPYDERGVPGLTSLSWPESLSGLRSRPCLMSSRRMSTGLSDGSNGVTVTPSQPVSQSARVRHMPRAR